MFDLERGTYSVKREILVNAMLNGIKLQVEDREKEAEESEDPAVYLQHQSSIYMFNEGILTRTETSDMLVPSAISQWGNAAPPLVATAALLLVQPREVKRHSGRRLFGLHYGIQLDH